MSLPIFTRQTDTPLFPQIFWNRPTMRSRGGRLLVVGGQKNEFSAVQAVYQIAEAAGVGECVAALPDSLYKIIGETGFGHFVPASTSGSLGKAALGELQHLAEDADATVIGANLTNNAETAVMIESLITKLDARVVITEDTIEVLKFHPALITGNPKALVVTTMAGLFALANHHHMPIAIRPNGGVIGKLEIINQLVSISKCSYMIFDQDIIVASEGKLSLTPLDLSLSKLPAAAIGVASTFWIQHPNQPFAALTTAAFVLRVALAGKTTTYEQASGAIRQTIAAHDQ